MVPQAGTRNSGVPGFHGFEALARGWLEALRRHASAMRERHRISGELTGLSDNQLDRVLTDLGLSRGDLDTFLARAPYSRDLLDRMMARLGIRHERAGRDTGPMRDIERRCAMCAVQRRCHSWLARSDDKDGYRRFCPNAEDFDRLIARDRTVPGTSRIAQASGSVG